MSVNWRIGHAIRLGGREVPVTIHEEYGEPGGPIHMKVFGAGGVVMEGSAEDIVKRLELLGVTPPLNPALAVEHSEPRPSPTSDGAAVPPLDLEPATLEPQALSPASAGEASAETFGAIDGSEDRQPEATVRPVSPELDDEIGNTEDEEMEMSEPEEEKASGASESDDERELESDEPEEGDIYNEEEDESPMEFLGKTLFRMLKEREHSDDPPLPMINVLGGIPQIVSTQEAANFIKHIDDNIRLTKMKADAARRFRNLRYLKQANRAKRCQHVKTNGMPCGAPALRRQQFCQFHASAHANSMEIPVIEDRQSLLTAHIRLAQQVAANKIDPAQAKVLLQILDSAGRNLSKSAGEHWEQEPTSGLDGILG